MGLITRFYGPNKKGSELTIKDMDDNLYFLQSKGVESVSFSSNTLTLINPTGGTLTTTIDLCPSVVSANLSGGTIYTINGENCQPYYRVSIDDSNPKTINLDDPLPVGSYVIYVEYNDATPTLSVVNGVYWPNSVVPTWSNTQNKVDIITIVSDGLVNRGTTTIGYDN